MAKQRSSKSTYPSRYDGGHVTIAQYITEYLCENIIRSRGKELPPKFWENEDWAKFYKAQIVLLNRQILPYYHPRSVVKALKDFRCKRVNSFGGFLKVKAWKIVLDQMDRLCRAEDSREQALAVSEVVDATKDKPRQQDGKQSLLPTLRELDSGESKEN